LTSALGTYTDTNYTAGNWTALTGFKATGDTNIEAALTTGAVTTAQTDATTAMAGVHTIAQDADIAAAAALASAKTDAHAALTSALGTYTQGNYTAENWTTLTGFKTAGDTAIDAATDLAGVTSAQDAATAGMAGVQQIIHQNNGGGSGGSRPATPAVPANITIPDGCAAGNKFSTTTGRNCNAATPAVPAGKVLGAASFHFTLFMKNNSKGNEVVELQKFLTALGYNLGTADGKFGAKTKAAVIKLQIANNLKGDGIVGPKVRALLNK